MNNDYWFVSEDGIGIVDVSRMPTGDYYVNRVFIRADKRNNGNGTRMMQRLVDRADKMGATLYIDPTENYGSNLRRLTRFFMKFGFVIVNDPEKGRMRRLPRR